jgi:hypothetical protein
VEIVKKQENNLDRQLRETLSFQTEHENHLQKSLPHYLPKSKQKYISFHFIISSATETKEALSQHFPDLKISIEDEGLYKLSGIVKNFEDTTSYWNAFVSKDGKLVLNDSGVTLTSMEVTGFLRDTSRLFSYKDAPFPKRYLKTVLNNSSLQVQNGRDRYSRISWNGIA